MLGGARSMKGEKQMIYKNIAFKADPFSYDLVFDDRITPGCHVAIKSNAIMGKKFGSSKSTKGGSRLIHYLDKDKPVAVYCRGGRRSKIE